MTKPIWLTDEQAIRAFRSVCRKQIELVIKMPQRAITMIGYTRDVGWGFNKGEMRINPYPPSFSKIAARTIDPAIGASTWAFGSHR